MLPGFGSRGQPPPSEMAAVAHRPRNWWSRNWKWVVPVVVLTPVLFCGGLLTLVFSVGYSALKNQWFYEQAVTRMRANAEVTAILGTPVDAGFPMGELGRSGRGRHADVSIPISGPDGKGTIYLIAEKSDGQWSFSALKVAIQPTGELIDLMGRERGALKSSGDRRPRPRTAPDAPERSLDGRGIIQSPLE